MHNETKKTALPNLRFPEFRDAGDWEEKTIGEICDVLNNRRKPITGSERTKGQYPYYGASGIVDYVKDFIFDERLLLVGEDGAKWGAFEETAFIVSGYYWVNNHAHVLRPKGMVDTLLEKYLVKLDLSPFVTGAAPPKLTLGKLKTIPVPLPPSLQEQQKIAATLSSLDDLITAQSAQLATLQAHKRGLMQALFPAEGETVPKLRFPEFQGVGEWKMDSLTGKDVAVFISEKVSAQKLKSEVYISTENLLADYGGAVASSKFPASGSCTRFKVGDILVSNIRPYLKKVWQADVDGAASNDVIVIRAGKSLNADFLAFILKNDAFIDYIMKGAEGVKMPRGDKDLIKEYSLTFPDKEEQQKIADCLTSLDNRIAAQTEKIEALKLHKKGLMQHLFPAAAEATA